MAAFPAIAADPVSDASLPGAQSAISSPAFESAKASFDAGDWSAAASAFEALAASPTAAPTERAEAAAFALRALANAGNHAAVADRYEALRAAAADTPFAAQCQLEIARSAYQNARDTTTALGLLGDILTRYPSDPVAAPGALYHRGMIELEHLRTPAAALATLETVATSWAHSAYADDALAAQARAGVALASLPTIDAARDRLLAMKASPALLQKVQFDRAEYFNNAYRDRLPAIAEYEKVFRDYPTTATETAILAKMRAADLTPRGEFRLALRYYDEILRDHPRLRPSLRQWAECQRGIVQFQLGQKAEAAATFARLLEASPGPRIRATAILYRDGLADPDSPAGIQIVYDRAIRWRQTNLRQDRAFFDMQKLLAADGRGFFDRFAADASRPANERATMLYRLALAKFVTGFGGGARETCERALRDLNPTGTVRWECEYLVAFTTARSGAYGAAADKWARIIQANPPVDFLPDCYLEWANAQLLSGDSLGAALAFEEARVRYPGTKSADRAQTNLRQILEREPDLRSDLAVRQPEIAARWKRPDRMLAAPPGSGPPDTGGGTTPLVAMPEEHIPAGGAQ